MIYNGFDFTHPNFKKQSIQRQRFLLSNYDKPITENQFVAEVASWPKRELRNSKSRSPSASRRKYRYLVEKYGFFKPKEQVRHAGSITNEQIVGKKVKQ